MQRKVPDICYEDADEDDIRFSECVKIHTHLFHTLYLESYFLSAFVTGSQSSQPAVT